MDNSDQKPPVKTYCGGKPNYCTPEQEPVAWVTGWHDGHCVIRAVDPALMLPIGAALYTTPPQRTWVGLTDEEIKQIELSLRQYNSRDTYDLSLKDFARAIESKLREKNK